VSSPTDSGAPRRGGARPREALRRLPREGSGQALVEFAIVVPLVVMVLLFAIWFTELVVVKLKVQEAARYAAWEATAYPLHDYGKGRQALGKLASAMTTAVTRDTITRYADMDSARNDPTVNRFFAARWTAPVVVIRNQKEEPVPGGSIVNYVFTAVATLFDFFSALSYKSGNVVALSLVAAGKDYGGARTVRMFGSSEWGFNRSGYIKATVSTRVANQFFLLGVRRMRVIHQIAPLVTESHAVLADSWRLNYGGDVYGDKFRPGFGPKARSTAYWKQVDRMFFLKKRARSVAKGWIDVFKTGMNLARAFSFTLNTPPNLGESDWDRPAVVSKNYKSLSGGKVTIVQDRGASNQFDTAPVCASCPGGDALKPYGQALKDRGKNFMGCPREMSLGCPSSTLQQDNPFGDYVVR